MKSYTYKLSCGIVEVISAGPGKNIIFINGKCTLPIDSQVNNVLDSQRFLYSVLIDVLDYQKYMSLEDYLEKTGYSESDGTIMYEKMKQHQELVSPILRKVNIGSMIKEINDYRLRDVKYNEMYI